MSSNIYEDPNLTMNVRYCKGEREDRGQRVERLVDIYEGMDTFTNHQVDLLTQDGAVQRNPFRAVALVLGLLCLLLVVGVTILSRLCEEFIYISTVLENNQDASNKTRYENRYCLVEEKKTQTQRNSTVWTRFRCSCYYKSTEMKNWTASRTDCQKRGADLVIINTREEQDFVRELSKHGASWIGLKSVKNGWNNKWEWVDGSTLTYTAWQAGMKVNAVNGSKAYINLKGTWEYINTGSNQWICEKPMY
ncbi:C-type lectin domain family 4 member C-like isoform X3 [Micropterus salmoides]|uniref:C-type lectin domain family 4 member C-like isoform X3 n=1 Tax=Micropterus salmoides TaxID=27706 RepID=UPI0018EC9477|nr:C-type lectin domain family 4 member C-like isoform X3 [Micropterus salmoides]